MTTYASSTRTRGKKPEYQVIIKSSAGVEVVGDMPEQFSMALANSWEARFAATVGDLLGTGGKFMGINAMFQDLTQLVWMNSSPIEIPLTLHFDAYNDALQDVFKPMQMLEWLALPENNGNFLTSPGPTVLQPDIHKISVAIGRVWLFSSVVISSVSSSYDMDKLDSRGYPIAGTSEITFSTQVVMGKNDWLNIDKQVKGGDLTGVPAYSDFENVKSIADLANQVTDWGSSAVNSVSSLMNLNKR